MQVCLSNAYFFNVMLNKQYDIVKQGNLAVYTCFITEAVAQVLLPVCCFMTSDYEDAQVLGHVN